jgi:hypothetical protein
MFYVSSQSEVSYIEQIPTQSEKRFVVYIYIRDLHRSSGRLQNAPGICTNAHQLLICVYLFLLPAGHLGRNSFSHKNIADIWH